MKNVILQLLILVTLCLCFSNDVLAQNTTSFGAQSGTNGSHNSFFGYQTGMNTNVGLGVNTFVGSLAGQANSAGTNNTFIGGLAGKLNTTGDLNTFVGGHAGETNSTGRGNTFIGRTAGRYNTTGNFNAFVGLYSGLNNTTGESNFFGGVNSGRDNTIGIQNTCVGTNAGLVNTTGNRNTYLGYRTGSSNVTGSNNVSIGFHAGYYETGDDKLHIANTASKSLIYGDFATDQVAIGTTDNYIPSGFTLAVGGKIIAEEIKVRLRADWPDYVFEKNYNKPTLEELEVSIAENGHLPNIPSAAKVEAEGYFLGEMDVKLLEKIEELTLYVIELNKEVKELKAGNAEMKNSK